MGAEVWCLVLLTLSPLNTDEPGRLVETAVKGKVVRVELEHVIVDVAAYAKAQKYSEDFSKPVRLPKYMCSL